MFIQPLWVEYMFSDSLPLDTVFVVARPLTCMIDNHVLDDHINCMLDHVRMLNNLTACSPMELTLKKW